MRYEFIINGEDVTDKVSLGANVKERFAEELDVGSITISYSKKNTPEKVLGLTTVKKYNDKNQLLKRWDMYIVDDEVEPITKDNNFFRHELTLIELTHKLDYYIVNALGFTQPIVETVTAPFKHTLSIDSPIPIFQKNTVVEFPEVPKLYSRYYESKIQIPTTGQVILSTSSNPDSTLLVEVGRFDLLLNVNRLYDDGVVEQVTINHNITTTPYVFDEVPDGTYQFIFTFNRNFTTPVIFPEDQSYIVNASREFVFETRFIKRKRYTMYDVINRIRTNYPLERADLFDSTRLFNINEELADKLKKIPAPQLYFNRQTVRETINSALKYVNAVCRLVMNGDKELVANFFNERRGSFIDDDTTKFTKSDEQSATNYVSNNRAFLRNTVSSNDVNKPSVNEIGEYAKGLRSEEYQVLPENGRLMLQYDIFRMVKIEAKVNLNVAYGAYETTGQAVPELFEEKKEVHYVDITPYIIEQSIFDQLDPVADVFGTSGNFNQLTNVPGVNGSGEFFRRKRNQLGNYKYRSNYIDFGGAVGSIYQRTKLARIMESAITEHLSFKYHSRLRNSLGNPIGSFVYRGRDESNIPSYFSPKRDLLGKDNEPLNLNNTDYLEEIGFRVSYIAIENTIDDAHKEDTEEISKYTEKVINNGEPVINYERASVSNYGISQRLGVPTKKYGRIEHSKNTGNVEEVGYLNDNSEVVVEKDNILYHDHETYALETSKDFNRLAKFISVDRQFRPVEIPQSRETLERDDIYTEYVEYSSSTNNMTPRQNNTFLSNVYLDTFLNTIARNQSRNKDMVKAVLLRTDGFMNTYPLVEIDPSFNLYRHSALLLPVISMGGKNNVSFEFKFKHNILAGDSVEVNRSSGIGTIADWWNGLSTQISNWLTFGGIGEEYSPRPYGLWRRMVPYGNENGEFEKLHFKFLTDFKTQPGTEGDRFFDTTRKYPIVEWTGTPSSYFDYVDDFTIAESGNPHTLDKALIVNKDVSEIYSLKYQVSLVPISDEQNRDLIIGSKLTSNNFLVSNANMKQLSLYLYNNPDDIHGTFDFEIAKEPDAIANLSVNVLEHNDRPYGFEITNPTLNLYHHWVIADDDGNIYLACNKNHRFVFFEPRNKRSTIDYEW